MSAVPLRQLHDRKLEVELHINASIRRFIGVGCFERDRELGDLLRINVADTDGNFALMLREGHQDWDIQQGTSGCCDYRIQLLTNPVG